MTDTDITFIDSCVKKKEKLIFQKFTFLIRGYTVESVNLCHLHRFTIHHFWYFIPVKDNHIEGRYRERVPEVPKELDEELYRDHWTPKTYTPL